MSRYITPGRSKVIYNQTVSTPSTPTNLEINAGVDLTPDLSGIPTIPRTGNLADASDLSSTFEKRVRGTVGGDSMSMELKRKTGTETAYAALEEGDLGYVYVFRKGFTGSTVSTNDYCDIYPVQVNTIADNTPGRNDVDSVVVELAIVDNPIRDYKVTST